MLLQLMSNELGLDAEYIKKIAYSNYLYKKYKIPKKMEELEIFIIQAKV